MLGAHRAYGTQWGLARPDAVSVPILLGTLPATSPVATLWEYVWLLVPRGLENEKLLEEISFEGPDLEPKQQRIDAAYVSGMLSETVKDQDLSRYIL